MNGTVSLKLCSTYFTYLVPIQNWLFLNKKKIRISANYLFNLFIATKLTFCMIFSVWFIFSWEFRKLRFLMILDRVNFWSLLTKNNRLFLNFCFVLSTGEDLLWPLTCNLLQIARGKKILSFITRWSFFWYWKKFFPTE